MKENGIKTKAELQNDIIGFVRSIGEEFPIVGSKMRSSMQEIENGIMHDFSPNLVSNVGFHVGQMMKDETSKFKNTQDIQKVICAIDEHFMAVKGSEKLEKLAEIKTLKRCLELEMKTENVMKRNALIIQGLKDLVGDGSILDSNGMVGIFTGFVAMAKGKKPEEIAGFANDLERAERIVKIFDLKDDAEKLECEKQEVIAELASTGNLLNARKMRLAKEIVGLKLKRLMRNLASYDDVREKRETGKLFEKMKVLVRIGNKEIQWNKIDQDCSRYFAGTSGRCQNDSCGHLIRGIFNAG